MQCQYCGSPLDPQQHNAGRCPRCGQPISLAVPVSMPVGVGPVGPAEARPAVPMAQPGSVPASAQPAGHLPGRLGGCPAPWLQGTLHQAARLVSAHPHSQPQAMARQELVSLQGDALPRHHSGT